MQVIKFFGQIENVNRAFFGAMEAADCLAEKERAYLDPKSRHHAFEFERWSASEDIDELRLNMLHARHCEARDALLLADVAAAAAAGALLQTAKQCIVMRWPKERRSNNEHLSYGRRIGSQPLSKVIWYARNQALHFEEGELTNPQTRECIGTLVKEANISLTSVAPRSLAREVVRVLGWYSYESYAEDIFGLVGEASQETPSK